MICDMNLFWNGVTSVSACLSLVATVAIYFLARKELIKNNEISELDIYFKIKSDLNSEVSQKIYKAILDNHLNFVRDTTHGNVRFTILESADNNWKTIPMADVDMGFLGHLEDLAMAHEKNLISLETIKSGYSSVILITGNAPCIYNYISYLRNEKFHDKELYSGFEKLYLKLHNELSEELKKKYRPVLC